MSLRRAAIASLSLALVLPALPAAAQEAPNLVRTWKGTAQAVSIGANPYRENSAGPRFSTNVLEFTFTITEQKDNRFSGASSDGKRQETLIGALSPNNQGGVILDDDGQYLFTIRDRDTLDACYFHHTSGSRVVACYAWKRVR